MTNLLDPKIVSILRTILAIDRSSYLVGGALRDYFLGKPQYADLDLVLEGDGFEIARQVANQIGDAAAFVPLDKEGGTGRIIISQPCPIVLDISSFKGGDILQDLLRRDFTINSMAIRVCDLFDSGITEVIDPCGGRNDLANRCIRVCSVNAFREDPIRILRAFRFSLSLGFGISPETLKLIPASLALLRFAAPERTRDEILAILSETDCAKTIEEMDGRGILEMLFPEISQSKACTQNDYHHLDVWEHCVETVHELEDLIETCPPALEHFSDEILAYVESELVKGRPRIALLKLAALFHDIGKPHAKTIEDGCRVRFIGHEKVSGQLFNDIGKRLKLARREMETMSSWVCGHMRPSMMASKSLSKRAIYRMLREFGDEVIGLMLLFLADVRASRGLEKMRSDEEQAVWAATRVLNEYRRLSEVCSVPFLNGHDLMALFGISQGPKLGEIIRALGERQDAGEIKNRHQALLAAEELLARING